jgi:hypothetical protein
MPRLSPAFHNTRRTHFHAATLITIAGGIRSAPSLHNSVVTAQPNFRQNSPLEFSPFDPLIREEPRRLH